jgi:HSP20 family protein
MYQRILLPLAGCQTRENEPSAGNPERPTGSFFRALRLPQNVDINKIQSHYESGVLTITMPKAEEKKKKQIKVSVGGIGKVIEGTKK